MNRKTKKMLAILLMVVVAFAFTACGGQEAEEQTISHEVTGDVLETDGDTITIELKDGSKVVFTVGDAPVYDFGAGFEYGQIATVCYEGELVGTDTSECTVTEVYVQMGDEKKVNGKMTAYSSDNALLTINNGENDLTFDVSGAERHYRDGLQVGNELTIDYYGVIDGTDTSHAYVTAVVDEEINTEKHKETVTVKAVHETVWTAGTVNIRTGSSTATEIVATVNKGTKLTRTGILSDGWSRVEYKGKDRYIFSDALTTKDPGKKKPTTTKATTTTEKPTTESTTAEPTTESTTTEPAGVESPVKGIITEFNADNSTHMTLKADSGDTYAFDVSKATIHLLDGEAVGQRVIVEFDGKIINGDTSGVTVKVVSSIVE